MGQMALFRWLSCSGLGGQASGGRNSGSSRTFLLSFFSVPLCCGLVLIRSACSNRTLTLYMSSFVSFVFHSEPLFSWEQVPPGHLTHDVHQSILRRGGTLQGTLPSFRVRQPGCPFGVGVCRVLENAAMFLYLYCALLKLRICRREGIVLWYAQSDFVIGIYPSAGRLARALSLLRTVFSRASLLSSTLALGASHSGPRLTE